VSIKHKALRLADQLLHMPRNEDDVEAAKLLRDMTIVYELAREMVHAKTTQHSQACYAELVDLFKGKRGN